MIALYREIAPLIFALAGKKNRCVWSKEFITVHNKRKRRDLCFVHVSRRIIFCRVIFKTNQNRRGLVEEIYTIHNRDNRRNLFVTRNYLLFIKKRIEGICLVQKFEISTIHNRKLQEIQKFFTIHNRMNRRDLFGRRIALLFITERLEGLCLVEEMLYYS